MKIGDGLPPKVVITRKGFCLSVELVNEDFNEETCSSHQEGFEELREQRHSDDGWSSWALWVKVSLYGGD